MKKRRTIQRIILIINIILTIFLAFTMFDHKLLPLSYRIIILAILIILIVLYALSIEKKYKKKTPPLIFNIIMIIVAILTGIASYGIGKGGDALDKISIREAQDQVEFSFVYRIADGDKDLKSIEKEGAYAALDQDKDLIEKAKEDFERLYKIDLKLENQASYIEAAQKLYDSGGILFLNESYRSLIRDQIPDFDQKTKKIDLSALKVKVDKGDQEEEKPIEKSQPFLAYISGADTYGTVEENTRSDVNLLMAVDPIDRKILIVNIPRDSYVKIPGPGGDDYDKLTHAGIYGINSSVETLENLFGIPINYYFKINFNSLVDMVDVLGGVTVYNDQAFTSYHGKYDFPKGEIELNGDQALGFVRERYSLKGGDIDRGKNHIKVLEAIINKATSPAILSNYNEILDVFTKSAQTNMPKEKMTELINDQIRDGSDWEMESQYLEGQGAMGLHSHAMPGYKLYMYQLDKNSVDKIGQDIRSTLRMEE